MPKQVSIYYCSFSHESLAKHFSSLLDKLPIPIRDDIIKYKGEATRHQKLIARLLLAYILKDNALETNLLNIKQNKYGRPLLNNGCDFNISHSGNVVVCAFSRHLKVGIDIEIIRSVKVHYFKRHMTQEQWDDIISSNEPLKTFFHYWTLKESVLKANGNGLRGDLCQIQTDSLGIVFYDNQTWQTRPLSIHHDYYCHLTYEYYKQVGINMKKITTDDFK
ncbi:MAG: 4'-phosphopantetheinyl transferase superfamily protein [Thermodesulfovibrionales bacterium]|nr:4'-phosphopantetheinyl transferase superfamily protein [Thermodesulfovibrionales bacterium]